MAEDLKKYLQRLLTIVDGLQAIVFTDRDGVPLLKVSTEDAPELALRSNFLSTFGMALEQGGKLGLGKSKSLVTFYGNSQVVCLNKMPLIVTMIATHDANTGLIMSLEKDLVEPLKVMKAAVDAVA